MKNKKWKQAGALAVMLALAATPVFASPLTEYTDAEMAAFRDNTLEYWEIPGLVEHYNPSYLNQLETFYGNPSGTDGTSMEGMMGLLKDSLSGLSVEQLKNLADELRATASDLEDELDEMELDKNDPLYQDYKSNIKSMKKYAKDAEARMDGTAAARRALKLVKNQMTIDLSAKMRSYQLLKVQDGIQQKKLEIAQLTYDSAVRQMELGMYAKENVLVAADGLNAARSAADASAASLNQVKQGLITALGWKYNGNPDILAVPEPNLEKIAGCSLEKDMESALSMNYDISDLRKTDAK
ncbi:MAG: hypothetical protein IIV75_00835, partial [Lachnospiraceae bacterium]|nr:hypothetical protein [Lachnospiraceae bacterium]